MKQIANAGIVLIAFCLFINQTQATSKQTVEALDDKERGYTLTTTYWTENSLGTKELVVQSDISMPNYLNATNLVHIYYQFLMSGTVDGGDAVWDLASCVMTFQGLKLINETQFEASDALLDNRGASLSDSQDGYKSLTSNYIDEDRE